MPPNFKAGAPSSVSEHVERETETQSRSPTIEEIHVRYGMIKKITKSNFVTVILLDKNGNPKGKEIANGRSLPINTPLSSILLQFGQLRPGLLCKVTWKGNESPNADTSVDIIGDEEHELLKKEPYPEEINIGPWRIFAGGATGGL